MQSIPIYVHPETCPCELCALNQERTSVATGPCRRTKGVITVYELRTKTPYRNPNTTTFDTRPCPVHGGNCDDAPAGGDDGKGKRE
jgi:hypothetical protein